MITSLARRKELATSLGRLERMLEIRAVEESIQKLYNDGHVRGSTHLANGQEAVSVGIASVIRPTDVVTCTYRGHAAALALGVTPEGVLGEICGRVIGCAGGIVWPGAAGVLGALGCPGAEPPAMAANPMRGRGTRSPAVCQS
jgi:pyruvate dehydrogenase E1 component alpha subunit